jgi:hypothetical protein
LSLPSFRLQRVRQQARFRLCACYMFLNLKFSRLIAFECRAYGARIIGMNTQPCRNSHKALIPGRVPHVRLSVHGLNTIFFECSYSICHGVVGEMRALEGLRPSYSTHVR